MELIAGNTGGDTLYFLDFGEIRSCDPVPTLAFKGEKGIHGLLTVGRHADLAPGELRGHRMVVFE